jgi:esterase/lipase
MYGVNRHFSVFIALFILFSGSAFAIDKEEHAGAARPDPLARQSTLRQVMLDLALSMNRIEIGILTKNRHMIRSGALAISNHPAPRGGIKKYLKRNRELLEKDMSKLDRKIHKAALKLSKKAENASMSELAEIHAGIFVACVGCHEVFR